MSYDISHKNTIDNAFAAAAHALHEMTYV